MSQRLVTKFPYLTPVDSLSHGQWALIPAPGRSFVPLTGPENSGSAAFFSHWGEGRIIVLTTDHFTTIDGLKRADNLVFITRLFERLSPNRQIVFLNTFPQVRVRLTTAAQSHGLIPHTIPKSMPDLSLWSLLKANPISWLLLQLLIALFVFFLSQSRRFGPLRPVPTDSVPKPTFVEGMGRLLAHSTNLGFVAHHLLDRFLIAARKRFVLSADAGIRQVLDRFPGGTGSLRGRVEKAVRTLQSIIEQRESSGLLLLAALRTLEQARKELNFHD